MKGLSMTYEKTMALIKRGTYRMKVIQEGGRFIDVTYIDDELAARKAEFDKIMYDREHGYSGFDEFHTDWEPTL
tara:strand:+ start:31 stop:252 length:222 start_codon:yes stop_codon:yes gene_type:complete